MEQVNSLLDKRNPFSTHGSAGQRPSIVALELEWDSVVGTDFLFPLHQDARLVLESRVLTKRLFHTVWLPRFWVDVLYLCSRRCI